MTKVGRATSDIGRNPLQHSRGINLSSVKDKFLEFLSTSAQSTNSMGASGTIMKPCLHEDEGEDHNTQRVINNGLDCVVVNGVNGFTKGEKPQVEPAADVKAVITELVKEICSHVESQPNVKTQIEALQSELQSLGDEVGATTYEVARISTDVEYLQMKEEERECRCCALQTRPGGGGLLDQDRLVRAVDLAMDDLKQDIENFKHDWAQELQSDRVLSEIANSVSSELRAREAKARNLIVYGLPEEECEDSHELVTRVLSLLGLPSICLFQAKRLGRWTGRTRPLLLTFSSETDRLMVLQNKFQLDYLPEASSIRIFEDLTPSQRAQLPTEWKKVKAARKQKKWAQIREGVAVTGKARAGRDGEQPHASSKHTVKSRTHPYRV